MPNTAIVASDQINGNISSCKTEITYLNCAKRTSLFYCIDVGYATNNCTGKVDNYESWSLTGTSQLLLALVAIVVFFTALKFNFDH